ncbi:MAG: DNA polymerase III subunit delta [Candidatus Nealsonbacteria bacterium CG23_combo_of_CG06-09_8_20_14_all_40_13]|uniref:DNA polymerase III subunit delta n=1 Tax=Candidatus Nealsonbacteria bacterium CG23_combo_of_CG06-09_8_20_14_all_40_13 TaxID=1974724 RepID=A0A2G9YQU2_9BACT|nr:MAG: DNA polymerase III subunit delta [Candidatus Nealsonbacteria bacterium CG23_combo_of_CG06-09_8_20_14_all_40_13]PIU43520.1 MAG: DNA polymerase III subunit delta [Candidatus Nealsonbacteria bacterium CG07_land_8_20_14_0_80_40_10]
MIYLLYGEDTFRSLEKLKAVKAKYRQASGDTNLVVIDAAEMTFDEIWQKISALPFLSSKRLVIVKDLITAGSALVQEKILKNLSSVPATTVVILFEQDLPKSDNKLYKKICQIGKCQKFALLKEWQLKDWLKTKAQELGLKINLVAIEKLALFVGNDLWRANQELLKLKNFKGNQQADGQDVELLVKPKVESDIFVLTDSIGQKNFPQAIIALHNLFATGQNESYILTMIAWQFKNVLILKDLLAKFDEKAAAVRSGLHSFVAHKAARQASFFDFAKLRQIYQQILDYDLQIKTGKIEPKAALELLVANLCIN